MRAIAVWFLCLLVPAVVATAVAAQDTNPTTPTQRPAVFSVAITTAAVRNGVETRTDVLLVWNRNERSTPIGHAVKTCVKAGSGDILGHGILSCVLVVSMPRGKIAATGIVHDVNRYTLVITGGTGEYEGVTGPLFVRRVADGVRRLTFILK